MPEIVVPGMSRESPALRPSARVVLLDPMGRVLLFRVRQLDAECARQLDEENFWITRGGGVEGDETFEECALRELREETGIEECELGPCVWLREHTWRWGELWIRSQERYFVGRTTRVEVAATYQTELEMQFLAEHRWWTVAEMRAATERLAPGSFAELAEPLAAGRWPAEPLVVGE